MSIPAAKRSPVQAWGLPLTCIRDSDGAPLHLSMRRPNWSTVVFFLGLASLVRCLLGRLELADNWATPAYVACLIGAVVTGQLIKGSRAARVVGAILSGTGFALTELTGTESLVAPLMTLVAVYGHTFAGELLYRLFPHRQGPQRSAGRSTRTRSSGAQRTL